MEGQKSRDACAGWVHNARRGMRCDSQTSGMIVAGFPCEQLLHRKKMSS